jgi:DNA mismatch endonuclease, patch repair protein
VFTPEHRRRAMASNRGRTKPELALARALWARGLRYLTAKGYRTLSGRRLVGHPDLVFGRKRTLVFVDGCFWHGCPKCKGVPQTSGPFWRQKIEGNIRRDREVTARLAADGWRVIRVPEHDVRTRELLVATTDRLAKLLRQTP